MRHYNIYFLDWKNAESHDRYIKLAARYPNVDKVNMCDGLASTVKLLAQLSDSEYFWVVSSTTDYTNFDFAAHNERGLEPYHQVFGANTWLMCRFKFGEATDDIYYIESFSDLHFVKSDLVEDQDLEDFMNRHQLHKYIDHTLPEHQNATQPIIGVVSAQHDRWAERDYHALFTEYKLVSVEITEQH
jgi:hypothetical protein